MNLLPSSTPVATPLLPPIDIVYLAPVCIFGFVLCPYLDISFHHARQAMRRLDARRAFELGFAVFFLAMIGFTYYYAPWLLDARVEYRAVALALAIHFIAQSGFTIGTHLQLAVRGIRSLIFAIVACAIAFVPSLHNLNAGYHGLAFGEIIYRCFMGFYGLIFPAYVWLCMIPPRRSAWHVLVSVALALPFFWEGFIQQRMIFLVPGVILPLAAKLIPLRQSLATKTSAGAAT